MTLVPDPPHALTSTEGWNVKNNLSFLKNVVEILHKQGIRVSIFIEPDRNVIPWAKETGTDRIELYTGHYARAFDTGISELNAVIKKYIEAAEECLKEGIGINAGHDLNLRNLKFFIKNVPGVLEVSIGHALISDAIFMGLPLTITLYKNCLKDTD